MNRNFKISVLLFIIICIAHFYGRSQGFYFEYPIFDIILHTIAGVMMGFIWLWLVEIKKVPVFARNSLSIVMFAVLVSSLWEVWEYTGHLLVPWVTTAYIPTLPDSLGDILSGFFGGFIAFLTQKK